MNCLANLQNEVDGDCLVFGRDTERLENEQESQRENEQLENIKKILNIQNIRNNQLVKDISKFLVEDKVELIGGAALALYTCDFVPGDYDIWVRVEDECDFISDVFKYSNQINGVTSAGLGRNIINVFVGDIKIQFIWVTPCHSMKQVVGSFDITCCMIRTFSENGKLVFKFPNTFIEGATKNRLAYRREPIAADSDRVLKYEKRGFRTIFIEEAPWFRQQLEEEYYYDSYRGLGASNPSILGDIQGVVYNMEIFFAAITLARFFSRIAKKFSRSFDEDCPNCRNNEALVRLRNNDSLYECCACYHSWTGNKIEFEMVELD